MSSRIALSTALAITLGFTIPCSAEVVVVDVNARVASIANFGTTDARAQFAAGDLFSFSLAFDTNAAGTHPYSYTAVYPGALKMLSLDFANGYAVSAAGGSMEVTNDSTWDQIYWEVRDQDGVDQIEASMIGNAKLVLITSALTDTRLTALSSTTLGPIPPLSAFTGTYVNLVFRDDSTGAVTQLNGRLLSVDIGEPSLPSLGLGEWHTCLVRAGGDLGCWGLNDYGQAAPVAGNFRQVSAGWIHSCGLHADRTLACWGNNSQNRATPPAGTFTQVSSGRHHSCALRTDGTVTCWGDYQFGQASPPSGTFLAIGAGQQHTCGVRGDRTLACWGANGDGQASPPAGTYRTVSGGLFHSCGLRMDGSVQCWGLNDRGQSTPPGGTFTQIDSGWHFNCGLRDDATVTCWGTNQDGQLNSPPGAFSQVDAGLWHACGVRADSTVQCWGDNSHGQAPQVSVQPVALPAGEAGAPYAQVLTLAATGYVVPAAGFALTDGALPSGLSLSAAGELAGTPVEVGNHTFLVTGEDLNGFAAAQSYVLAILPSDRTAPTITPVVTGQVGNDDWYTGNVAINWTVLDAESAIISTSGCGPASLNTDSSGTLFTCTATSGGGTDSESVTVKRDATAPTLAPLVTPDIILLNGSGSIAANASDALAGLATQACAALNTSTVGDRTSECTATDIAGNTASGTGTYTVRYDFGGFTPPVDNPPAVNLANAGQTIPFKWRLVDAAGSPVSSLNGVTLRAISTSCNGSAVVDEVEQYVSSGTGFINRGNGDYQYNWKSPTSYQTTCKQIVLDMGDGSSHEALFRFH